MFRPHHGHILYNSKVDYVHHPNIYNQKNKKNLHYLTNLVIHGYLLNPEGVFLFLKTILHRPEVFSTLWRLVCVAFASRASAIDPGVCVSPPEYAHLLHKALRLLMMSIKD